MKYDRNRRSIQTTNLLKLCFIKFPDLARPILKNIYNNDYKVLKLSKELSMGNIRTDLEIIKDIEEIRKNNNNHWMDLMRLAFEHSPNEARIIVTNIEKCDEKVTQLLKELSDEKS